MFDGGVPEQIHRFIASPPPPPPLPPHQPAAERSLPFPVSFTSFNTNHHMLNLDSRKIIHHHHYHYHRDIKDGGATSEWLGRTDHHDGDNHHHHHHHPWCSDEVLALLRFRSTVENWFPEFTWEHTSRYYIFTHIQKLLIIYMHQRIYISIYVYVYGHKHYSIYVYLLA